MDVSSRGENTSTKRYTGDCEYFPFPCYRFKCKTDNMKGNVNVGYGFYRNV